ncbi:MAG: DUF222 domain-containing protein [Actinomycetota bacterium]|nr:MAG: DUF222 domain-containing protein [Actinomycetota bacterium]
MEPVVGFVGVEDEALAALNAGVDALSGLDLVGLSDDRLHALTIAVQRCTARLGVARAAVVRRWDTRGVWAGDGSRSPAHRLARETNTSTHSARVELARARDLAVMLKTRDAIDAGRLSLDHVYLFAKARKEPCQAAFADSEQWLVDQCARLPFPDAERLVRYWRQRADAAAAEDEAERNESANTLHASATLDGTVVINGQLDAVSGAVFTNELQRLERQLLLADKAQLVVRTATQRRAAALVEMAKRSAASKTGRQRPLITVLVGDQTLRHMCELSNGTVITPGQAAGLVNDALVESVIFDNKTTVIAVTHKRRFTGALRRAIEVRDRRCQHSSGCYETVERCDVDHITAWRDGGPTSQFNGRLLCAFHNRHPDVSDHHQVKPQPVRPIDDLDRLRALIRWRNQQAQAAEDKANDNDDDGSKNDSDDGDESNS